jgi:hypothetical protein
MHNFQVNETESDIRIVVAMGNRQGKSSPIQCYINKSADSTYQYGTQTSAMVYKIPELVLGFHCKELFKL